MKLDAKTLVRATFKATFWILIICAAILVYGDDKETGIIVALCAAYAWLMDGYYYLLSRIRKLEEKNP